MMEKSTSVMIVEDHAIFREGLKKILSDMPGIRIVGEAENGAVFLQLLRKVVPDIVLMDIKMPVMDGIQATDQALKLYPHLKIIILSMFGEEEYLYTMILKGISGFLLKSTSMNSLERAIRMASNGEQYFSSELNGLLAKKIRQFSSRELPTFTGKENEVLRLLCKGYSTDEIAAEICISKRTVEGYRARLIEKTGMTNTLKLVLYALRNKLVNLQDIESTNA
jgi:DNA-binding NarL/FixJ family response regulator